MNLKPPSFDGRPIGSMGSLASALGVPAERLRRLSVDTSRFYRGPITLKRAGRKDRIVWAAVPELRDVQQRISDRIIKRANFPEYLQGGLKGRSYQGNAHHHAGSKILFGQDVTSFYDSISTSRVESIFVYVFCFPPIVATLLANLCCRDDKLVQGSVASTHLANLSLFDAEPRLEAELRILGLRYTRYLDDLHSSSSHRLPASRVTQVVSAMRSSLERQGLAPKRSKQFVATAGNVMRVHGLNVNGIVSSPSRRRQKIRNEVFLLERWAGMESWNSPLERCYLRLCSQVGSLAPTNPGEARRLKSRLSEVSKCRAIGVTS
jgi:Reverse transcriptase (RNA-dependent DNA polymerase)